MEQMLKLDVEKVISWVGRDSEIFRNIADFRGDMLVCCSAGWHNILFQE